MSFSEGGGGGIEILSELNLKVALFLSLSTDLGTRAPLPYAINILIPLKRSYTVPLLAV